MEQKGIFYESADGGKFSDLLLDISARLISTDPDYLNEEINKGLRIISESLNFDWSSICEFSSDESIFNNVHSYFVPRVNLPDVTNIHNETRFITKKVRSGEMVIFRSIPDDLPKDAAWDRIFCKKFGVKSSLALPCEVSNSIKGGLYFASLRMEHFLPDKILTDLHNFAEILAGALERRKSEEKIKSVLLENEKLRKHIEDNRIYLKEDIAPCRDFPEIIGKSDSLKKVIIKIRQVAPTDATVLLLGDTGTGKGLVAGAIHSVSSRKGKPFIQVNCASLAPGLVESELFGHERGAFTGAQAKHAGYFERSHNATLFLDEIGELSSDVQAKLLRALQEGEFERVGGSETLKADVRLIAATNKNMEKEIAEGRFRRDLWYRLNVFPIRIPSLRERLNDIPDLARFFLDRYSKRIGRNFKDMDQNAIRILRNYSWPGNIRELENVIMRAVISSDADLHIEIPDENAECLYKNMTLHEFERAYIIDVLEKCIWRIEGQNGAAKRLGLKPSTLRLRMKKLKIYRPATGF